jgi:hypothetical protein
VSFDVTADLGGEQAVNIKPIAYGGVPSHHPEMTLGFDTTSADTSPSRATKI